MRSPIRKIAAVASAVLLAGVALSGCSSTASNSSSGSSSLQGKKILMVPYWLDNFDTAWANWVTRDFAKVGVKVSVINANAVSSRQLNAIDTAVSSGQYDGIIWGPIDSGAASATVRKIQAAKIPQVVFGAPLTDVKVPQLQINGKEALTKPAEIAATYVKAHPALGTSVRAAFLSAYPATTDCKARFASFERGLKNVDPNASVVFNGGASNSSDAADKMADFINRDISFNVFDACGADLGLGGLAAMKSAGLATAKDKEPTHVFAMTQDATPPELQQLWSADSNEQIASLLPPKDGAASAVKLMTQQLQGKIPLNSTKSALISFDPITPDCAKYRSQIVTQFKGVNGFTVPKCTFSWTKYKN